MSERKGREASEGKAEVEASGRKEEALAGCSRGEASGDFGCACRPLASGCALDLRSFVLPKQRFDLHLNVCTSQAMLCLTSALLLSRAVRPLLPFIPDEC